MIPIFRVFASIDSALVSAGLVAVAVLIVILVIPDCGGQKGPLAVETASGHGSDAPTLPR
jgi:hypothetical protein